MGIDIQIKGTIDTKPSDAVNGGVVCGPCSSRLCPGAPGGFCPQADPTVGELEAGVGDGGGPGVVDDGLRGHQGDQPGTRGVVEDPFDGVFGVGDRTRFEPQIRHVGGVAGISPEFERYFVVQLARRSLPGCCRRGRSGL